MCDCLLSVIRDSVPQFGLVGKLVRDLDAQTTLLLRRQDFIPRFTHRARSVSPSAAAPAAAFLHDFTMGCLGAIMGDLMSSSAEGGPQSPAQQISCLRVASREPRPQGPAAPA